jgi:hypothetical protein
MKVTVTEDVTVVNVNSEEVYFRVLVKEGDDVLAEKFALQAKASAEAAKLDAQATAADRVQTGLDAIATAADRVQTGLDVIATAADRVQTGLDAQAAAQSAAQANIDVQNAINDILPLIYAGL